MTIYRRQELGSDKMAFLALGPHFSLLEELDLEQAKLDIYETISFNICKTVYAILCV